MLTLMLSTATAEQDDASNNEIARQIEVSSAHGFIPYTSIVSETLFQSQQWRNIIALLTQIVSGQYHFAIDFL